MSDNTHSRVQQDPLLADSSDRFDSDESSSPSFHIPPSTHSNNLSSSNILRLGSLNVRSLVSPTKQLNLFSILLSHALACGLLFHSYFLIRSARSSDHSVLLGGDLNADLEFFLKQLTAAHPGSSPLNPLFKFLHEQQFDDLCELDSSSLYLPPPFVLLVLVPYPVWIIFGFLPFSPFLIFALAPISNRPYYPLAVLIFLELNISLSRPKDIPYELRPYTRLSNSLTTFVIFIKEMTTTPNYDLHGQVLDRVLVVDLPESPKLLVAPEEIKAAAITHFQNVVDLLFPRLNSLTSLPPRWKDDMLLLEAISKNLYTILLWHLFRFQNFMKLFHFLLLNKAPGPSSIPYEWFKVLPETALDFLCELMNRCLVSSDIPEDWRFSFH
ncbi:unnamed protein product [Rhizophagus irregularis]|nr:unnamed protein product [Rhizophagus irregularis]